MKLIRHKLQRRHLISFFKFYMYCNQTAISIAYCLLFTVYYLIIYCLLFIICNFYYLIFIAAQLRFYDALMTDPICGSILLIY